jgi:gas vesicle protein GvpL/GvpF
VALLLHAITPTADATDRPLVTVSVANVTAWASTLDPRPFTKADLLDHHRIITDVFEMVDACLPARFPTIFETARDLETHLTKQHAVLERQLEAVRHACELAVTAVWRSVEVESTKTVTLEGLSPGRAYLAERQRALNTSDRRHARAIELANAVEAAVGPDLLDSLRTLTPSATVALSLALLVPRAVVENVKVRVPRLERDVRILVNGPWPPYSFAGSEAEQGHG